MGLGASFYGLWVWELAFMCLGASFYVSGS